MPSSSLPPRVKAILHRWRAATLFFVVVFGLVVASTFLARRSYASQAKLFVRLGRENVALDPTTTIGAGPVIAIPPTREQEINTIIETIYNRTLIEEIVDILGPEVVLEEQDWNPEGTAGREPADRTSLKRYQAVLTFLRHLDVRAAKRTTVIEVSYQTASPELAQRTVKLVVEKFLEQHLQLNRVPEAYRFLAEQAERSRKVLDKLEKEFGTLKSETGLYSAPEQRQILVTRLGRLQDEKLQTDVALRSTETEVAKIQETLKGIDPVQVTAQVKGLANEAADRMREVVFSLQVKEKDLLSRHPESHPDVELIRKQTKAAKEIFDRENRAREQVTTGPNRLYEEMQAALHKQVPSLAALRAKSELLADQIQQESQKLAELDKNAVQVSRLRQEVDLQEGHYRKYSENQEQAQIDQTLRLEKISNIRILQPASFNPKPVRPNVTLNLAAGFLFAGVGSLALATLLSFLTTTKSEV